MNIYDQIHANTPKDELTKSFIVGCQVSDLDAIKSLLENPEFEKHIDVHADDDLAFQWALSRMNTEVLHYLIMEYGIEKPLSMDKFAKSLSDTPKKDIVAQVEKMFEIRDTSSTLEKELVKNGTKNKKAKL